MDRLTVSSGTLMRWRKARGLSLLSMGKLVGVSDVAVLDWERGTVRPAPHFREIIEIVTAGAVKAADWMLATERKAVEEATPFTAALQVAARSSSEEPSK